MSKYRLLDLFCCAGGSAVGYYRAGFDVFGVDNDPKPLRHYPFPHVCADALEYVAEHGNEFDAIHASPPCQFVTRAAGQWRKAGREYPDLIQPMRQALKAPGCPYIIENVRGAPLIDPVMLNGAMFGLRVKRDRLFETNWPIAPFILPPQERPIKEGRPFDVRRPGTFYPVGHFSGVAAAREAMGIDWMTRAELAQAIPPCYTQWIGVQLRKYLDYLQEASHAQRRDGFDLSDS